MTSDLKELLDLAHRSVEIISVVPGRRRGLPGLAGVPGLRILLVP